LIIKLSPLGHKGWGVDYQRLAKVGAPDSSKLRGTRRVLAGFMLKGGVPKSGTPSFANVSRIRLKRNGGGREKVQRPVALNRASLETSGKGTPFSEGHENRLFD
jgi:hypothetical protein